MGTVQALLQSPPATMLNCPYFVAQAGPTNRDTEALLQFPPATMLNCPYLVAQAGPKTAPCENAELSLLFWCGHQ